MHRVPAPAGETVHDLAAVTVPERSEIPNPSDGERPRFVHSARVVGDDLEPHAPPNSVGGQLRRARHLRGWTLSEAAAASHGRFKASTLSAYERGVRRVTANALEQFAQLYDTPVSSLLPSSDKSDDPERELAERIARLPRQHRELLTALVDRMFEDTRSVGFHPGHSSE
jgi:transcriptional regulator with XRE-family HTH domain